MNRDQLREYTLSLPGVEEVETWGHPTMRVGGKIFASFPDDPGGSPQTMTVKASPAEQRDLLAEDPETFARAPRVGRFGWVTVQLDGAPAGRLRELVHTAWHRTAPASTRGAAT